MSIVHKSYRDVESEIPDERGANNVTIRWLISKKDGAKNFAMRLFEIEKNGCTPYHRHDWEHEVFILEGEGTLVVEGEERKLRAGDFLFIPPMEWHQFKNDESESLRFLCLVPIKDK